MDCFASLAMTLIGLKSVAQGHRGRPITPHPSHSTQDSITIRSPTERLGVMSAIRRHKTAISLEEALPVRHYDWIAHFGRRTPDKIAAVDLASQRRLSYAEFDARI